MVSRKHKNTLLRLRSRSGGFGRADFYLTRFMLGDKHKNTLLRQTKHRVRM